MSNKYCNGDFFVIDGVSVYRCFMNGKTMALLADNVTCPVCGRMIEATHHKEVEIKPIYKVNLPIVGWVEVDYFIGLF